MLEIFGTIFERVTSAFEISKLEEYHTHINPDGTSGGRVAKSAQVDPTAYVEKFAKVLPGAIVGPGQLVRSGDMLLSDGYTLRFD